MRNTIEIMCWLKRKKVKQTEIAKQCGVHKGHVWGTIHGIRNDRPVLAWLKENECPVEFLALPADMREAA